PWNLPVPLGCGPGPLTSQIGVSKNPRICWNLIRQIVRIRLRDARSSDRRTSEGLTGRRWSWEGEAASAPAPTAARREARPPRIREGEAASEPKWAPARREARPPRIGPQDLGSPGSLACRDQPQPLS